MQPDPPVARKDPARWRMLTLAALAYGSFGIGVASIPPIVEPIIDDLGMTSGQMGVVLGAWQLVFIGASSPLGSLVDRWGTRWAVTLGLGLMLVSIATRGLAVDFVTLLLSVGFLGLGAPIIAVAMPKVVGQWFSGADRGPATGAYVVGRDVGAVLALFTAGSLVIAITGSWRGISAVYGVIVFAVMLLWIFFGKDGPPVPAAQAPPPRPRSETGLAGVMGLLKMGNVRIILVLGFVVFVINHALGAWLPTVLQEGGFSLADSGRIAGLGIVVSMFTNFAVPSLARLGNRRFWIIAMLGGGALTSVGLAVFEGVPLIAMALVGTAIRHPAMQVLTLMLMETPRIGAARVGLAGGLFFGFAEIGGFVGPLAMGLVRDATGGLTAGIWTVAIIGGVAALLPLLVKERADTS